MKVLLLFLAAAVALGASSHGEIGIISPAEARALIEHPDAAKRPVVLDTRGGYKDYFRGHLPTAHHLEFDTLRGTDNGVPVQYLPDDLTKKLLIRAGVDRNRTHILYATGEALPNDEILSATMVAYVLEKFGVPPASIPDYLALVGDSADGFPGIRGFGPKTAADVISRFAHIEDMPDSVLKDQRELALLFKDLATLRTDAPLFADVDELKWRGPTSLFADYAAKMGDERILKRAEKAASLLD